MYHLVWISKYRKRILKGALKIRIEEFFHQCAEMNDWHIEELNIQLDHVYMLIQKKPTINISDAIQLLKGGSSCVVRKEFPYLEEFLWETSFRADGYFAETTGKVSESMIRQYIQN